MNEKGLTNHDTIRVETRAGQLVLNLVADNEVLVDMGVPRHAPDQVPLEAAEEAALYTLEVAGEQVRFAAVSMGNPHAVIQVASTASAPVERLGPLLESHSMFPERVNVGFLEVVNRQQARLRVYERGSGETLACGSGACAAAVVGIEQGFLESPVDVELPGGHLIINWQGRGFPVMMQGPAVTVFEGEIEL